MGAKITVDSATLMNKGLEVIEAHVLFDLPYDRIEVVVHPQSIVHGMARFRDGALLAHVGHPDMRVPISYALTYPERAATSAPRFDVDRAFSLDFEPPDTETFRCLALARAAGEAGGTGALHPERRQRGGRRRVPRGAHRLPGHRRAGRRRARPRAGRPRRRPRRRARGRRRGARRRPGRSAGGGTS